jgi:superfamily II DNA or RNA helicase
MTNTDTLRLLDQLERSEAALLTWGFVDGGFTEDEVSAQARDLLGLDEYEAEEVLEDLLENSLLVRIRLGRRVLYRTRSAEAIRLLARLRQLFPQHLANGGWRHAPTLVSDFRYSLRLRTYPARAIDASDAAETISAERDEIVRKIIEALLLSRGDGFQLARFQVLAAKRILEDLDGRTSRGTIIAAGTGSGKTLAFYLPALAHSAARIGREPWTKAIAVYPRNELLKDQFSETFTEARRLDRVLLESAGRKLTIGAFFGPTPHSAQALATRKTWQHLGNGFVCPHLRCPGCGGDLVWTDEDVAIGHERLACRKSGCGASVSEDEVILTRGRMRRQPPDILFTTTEMLNRQLSDSTNGHIFGVGPRAPRKPELMLLDEVHTYEGTTGAQAAYVIRRWRRAMGRSVQFVGLSATLREAQTFFAELVGLADHAVASITPGSSDLISEGMEYLLALRGDPVSGTSLLSTTIQASMLLRRTLELEASANVPFGSRLFVFTDDLDVTNRLYFDLLDAEGRDSWGRPNPLGNGPLAALRASTGRDHAERLALGQSWDLCEAIGHHLDAGGALHIGRTSSQDPGVASVSDVIVATASLDVGFNDPTVGAVLQHKAPRGAAQFLQRKGRAGRLRGMRPWTVVVLSDYGRDRLAYQGYDLLFDPLLEARSLPLQNMYVLRIQAAFALMDWLASKLPQYLRGSVWLDLAGPRERNQPKSEHASERQKIELELIESALSDKSVRSDLLTFVQQALRLTPEQTEVVAWEAPRSLLLQVLPTLRRRLASGWGSKGVPGADYQARWQPMPDFVPANLFTDLNLPETRIQLPPAQRDSEESETQSPVLQALRTFAPGRISRRYGVEHRYVRHWVPVPLDRGAVELDVASFVDGNDLGTFTFGSGEKAEAFQCIRPWSIRTERPPQRLLDSTNATLDWRSRFEPTDDGDDAEIPSPSPWDDVVRNITLYMHARQSGVDLSRLAVASHATLAFEGGRQSSVDATFTVDGRPAALGFPLDVDAVRVEVAVPTFFAPGGSYRSDAHSMRSFRASYFQHLVETDDQLLAVANPFQLQWLGQLYMSVVVERALSGRLQLDEAHSQLVAHSIGSDLQHVLDVIFQALPTSTDATTPAEADEGEPPRQRLHQALSELIDDPLVAQRVAQLAAVLWSEPDDAWQRWAARRFAATVGAAFLEGADRMCRDVGAQNLVLDTDVDDERESCRVWLSEPTIGGGGIIEEFARRYLDDPRRFFRLVESALAPSDFEIVDSELVRALELAMNDQDVKRRMLDVRSANSQTDTTSTVRELLACLAERGVAVSHPVIAALNARVLRPGSSNQTDALLHSLVLRWRGEEERLGIEIDARVFAFVASASDDVDRAVPPPSRGVGDQRQRRFATVYGLLWPRGSIVRASSLKAYNPYHPHPPTDRALVLTALRTTTPVVHLSDPSWRETLTAALVDRGTAFLRASPTQARDLRSAIIEVQGIPVDAGYLMLHPRVIGLAREEGHLLVRLELREAFQ